MEGVGSSSTTTAGRRAAPRWGWALALVALAVSGCATGRGPAPDSGRTSRPTLPPSPATGSIETETAILATARSLLGSGYRYGGESRRSGFDCSGFARYVFARHGVPLPRTTAKQAQAGSWVPLDALGVGDLVFFSDEGKPSHHVGIVSSRSGEPLTMVHASTSRGVVETEVVASDYWLRRLRFGRRVVPR